jgi:signal transduction histidine kinase
MSIKLQNFIIPKHTVQRILDFLPYPFLMSQLINGVRTNTYVNVRFTEEIGYTCKEIPTIHDWFRLAYPDPEYRKQIEGKWYKLVDTPDDTVVMKARIKTNFDSYKWFEVKSSLFEDVQLVSFVNIDDVMVKEEELERTNENKDKILSILGHDLRSPIANLQAISRMALQSDITHDEFKHLLGQLNEKSFQVMEFLDTTLQWTRSNFDRIHLQKKDIDIQALWSTILPIYKPSADGKNITVTLRADDNPFQSDSEIITIVLRNLLSNAIKFSGEGGSITIQWSVTNTIATLSVTDTGVGMTQQTIDRILLENYSSQNGTRHEKGLGLGLKLCKDLVKKINGELRIESIPEKGTTITVVLP